MTPYGPMDIVSIDSEELKQLDGWKLQSRLSVELIVLKKQGYFWRVCISINRGLAFLNSHQVHWFLTHMCR